MPPQVKQIKMGKVACNLVEHQGKSIKTLCLNPLCKASSTLCSKCLINDHLGCRSQIIELEKIPKQLIELQQLQLAILTLQENINQQFKKLLFKIEKNLLPLVKYQDSPNFTNLNEIGFLLKQLPKQRILNNIDEANIEIRILLDNYNKEKYQEDQKQSDVYWYKEGRTLLLQNRYEEAKKCLEEAIRINPNHQLAIIMLRNLN